MKRHLIIFMLVITACQVKTKRVEPTHTDSPAVVTQPPPAETSTTPVQPMPTSPPVAAGGLGATPKIGLILGPGAMRGFAHVGVVQEFAKSKLPIQSVVGIEMGALVAAIYANKGLPYDVEWQMMKLKESDLVQKGLLSGQKAGDVQSTEEFLNTALSSSRAENSKVSFACPAFHMGKSQAYMMNRGVFSEMLRFCLAFPPLFKPYQQNVSGVLDLKAAVDYVRSKGATYVIYVDLLSRPIPIKGAEVETQILWSLMEEALSRPEKGIDYVVRVPLQDFDLMDFNRRREVIQLGQKAALEAYQQISKKMGF